MTYKATPIHAMATVDNYEEGQTGRSQSKEYDLTHTGETIAQVLQSIADTHNLEVANLVLDCCEEKGRIDTSFMENVEAEQPSETELAAWKDGKCELWCIDISYQLTEYKQVSAII